VAEQQDVGQQDTHQHDTHQHDTEPWQETPRGSAINLAVLALPGVEMLRTLMPDGVSVQPPVVRLSGRRLVSTEPGEAVYALPKSDWYLSAKGRMHPGMLAFLADAALTGAIQSALPPRTICATAELSVTFCAAVPRGSGSLIASARTIHVDDDTGLAEVFVTDEGVLVAHGTSRTVIQSPIPDRVDLGPIPASSPRLSPDDTPDPWQRPVPGDLPDPDELGGRGGLEVLQNVVRGQRSRAPVDRLFGVRIAAAAAGRVVFEQPAHGWLGTERGTVYGGMTAFLAMSAASAAVQSVAAPETVATALDLKVNFLRPVKIDGQPMTATGEVRHRGQQLVIADSTVMHAGKPVVVATGTTALRTPARR
jgi:uncharacterized protein (TIGR00369 family)